MTYGQEHVTTTLKIGFQSTFWSQINEYESFQEKIYEKKSGTNESWFNRYGIEQNQSHKPAKDVFSDEGTVTGLSADTCFSQPRP
jgi:hypothetical protein